MSGFGPLLRAHRKAAGLTQEALAARSGLSVDAISLLERGRSQTPRSSTIALLADALGLEETEAEALRAAAGWPAAAASVPHELPRPDGDFTGRDRELALLRELLDPARSPLAVGAIEGMGGVGKSALAVQAAHQVAGAYPDGQIYVNLRGTSAPAPPLEPLEALGHMLRSLGIETGAVPAEAGEAAARFRSLTAGRRLLVLLDDARDAEQVRPLLPAGPGCGVLVTSRRTLGMLEGTRRFDLPVLPEPDALELLGRLVGSARVEDDLPAARDVVTWCGRLPLAVRVAGARLAARPARPIRELAEHLADASARLSELQVGEQAVKASFDVSLRAMRESADPLDAAAADAFALLSLPDGPDIETGAAARLLAAPEPVTRRLLERLVDAHLLEIERSGRYRFHDLVRLCAREEAERRHPAPARAAAIARLAGFYTATAWGVRARLRPADRRLTTADPRWRRGGLELPEPAAAVHWLEVERVNLLSAIGQAAALVEAGAAAMPAELPSQLARALFGHISGGHLADQVRANVTALRVSERIGDVAGQAYASNDLGVACEALGRYEDAIACHERALALFRELGDRHGEAGSQTNLGLVYKQLGRVEEAIACQRSSLEAFSELGDRRGQATSLHNLGVAYARAGAEAEALRCLEESLAAFWKLGGRLGQAAALHDMGLIHTRAGRHAEAVARQRQSLAIYREQGSRLGQAHSLLGLGQALAGQREHGAATACLRESLTIFREAGAGRDQALALGELGDVLAARGDGPGALVAWRRALAIGDRLRLPEAGALRARVASAHEYGAGAVGLAPERLDDGGEGE